MNTILDSHMPVIAPAHDGWGVICDACSAAASEYVYPCSEGWPTRGPWHQPPRWLVDRAERDTARAEVARLQGLLDSASGRVRAALAETDQ